MSSWICCNSCFLSHSADRKLALTNCGHIICSVCYQKGNQGQCLICNAKCQLCPLSDKSSSAVKALFSDIKTVATKHSTEISKVLTFQARHQKRLLAYYQQRNEKLEQTLVKMKQEMQQMKQEMMTKLNEQSIYITKLKNSLQHQSAKTSCLCLKNQSQPVLQIACSSPMLLSRHPSAANVIEDMELDERSLFRKPTFPKLSLISSPKDGRTGTVSHRRTNQNPLVSHSASSATVSRFQGTPVTPDPSYGRSSGWTLPSFRQCSSMPSLNRPPP